MSERHWLGIDVGGTTIKVCRAGDAGTRLDEWAVPTPRGVPELVDTVVAQAAEAQARSSEPLAGIGAVVPGIVDEASGTAVLSVNLGWRDVPMQQLFSTAIGRPVAFGHDVRAGALAEARWGAGSSDMLYVPIGTGIAAGVVLDGRAISNGGYAGEIGQVLVIDPYSGERVRLEAVASAASIAHRDAERRADPDNASARAGAVDQTAGGARAVVDRARSGDPIAQQVFGEAVDALADVLATTVGALGPIRIVLGGGLAGAGDLLLDAMRAALADRLLVAPVPEVATATLGSWSQALGAASLAIAQQENA